MRKVLFLYLLFIAQVLNSQSWIDEVINPSGYNGTFPGAGTDVLVDGTKIYYVGNDLKVHNYYQDFSGKWQEFPLNATMPSAIAGSGLVKDYNNNIYYVGQDLSIYKCNWTGSAPWTVTKIIPTVGAWLNARNNSKLAISYWGTDIRIFYTAIDGKIHYLKFNGSVWESNLLMNGSTSVGASSSLLSDNFNRVIFRDVNGIIRNIYQYNNTWYDFPLNNSVARYDSHLTMDEQGRIFFISNSDSKIHFYQYNSGWIDNNLNPASTDVIANCGFTFNEGKVFYRGTDGYIKSVDASSSGNLTGIPTYYHHSNTRWATNYMNNTYGASYYFTQDGKLHRLIKSGIINVVNVTPGNGKLFEKFELGVDIPSNLETDINNFCNNAHIQQTATYQYPLGNKNPYDPNTIMIKSIFSNGNDSYVRYGFFYRDVSQPNSDANPYYISKTLNTFPFRVRIAPEKTGVFSVTTELYVNQVLITKSTSNFNVDPSSRRGKLSFPGGVSSANKYLVDSYNNDFFIVGQNLDCSYKYSTGNPGDNLYDQYITQASRPISDHLKVRNTIDSLSQNKSNFVRIRNLGHSYELEGAQLYNYNCNTWDPNQIPARTLNLQLGNYDTRQHVAYELDNTINSLESKNVYAMYTLFYDPFFINEGIPAGGRYSNQDNFAFNPYGTLNGALIPTIMQDGWCSVNDCSNIEANKLAVYNFFSDYNISFEFVKRKLFYIMARWGYSPNIAMWQAMNETDNIGNFIGWKDKLGDGINDFKFDNNQSMYNTDYHLPPPHDPNAPGFKTVVENWITNVNSYLKSFYPNKLHINGYGNWASPLGGKSQNPSQDIASANFYKGCIHDNPGVFAQHNMFKTDPNANKSFLSSENGFITQVDWCTDVEAHKAVWSSSFSGSLGTPLYFWDQYQEEGVDHRTKFKHIADFFSSLNSISPNYLNSVGWANAKNEVSRIPYGGNPSAKKIENYYMRSSDKNTVIGWFCNYSFNWYSFRVNNSWPLGIDPNCNQQNLSETISNFNIAAAIGVSGPTCYDTYSSKDYGLYQINATNDFVTNTIGEPFVYIDDLYPNTTYKIEFFDPYYGGYLAGFDQILNTNPAGKLNFSKPLNNNVNYSTKQYPDYAYRVVKMMDENARVSGVIKVNDDGTAINIYPNPNKGKFVIENYFKGKVNYSILDLHGRVIREFVVDDEKIEIDLSNYDKGIYFIKCNINGTTEVKKVIVQ